MENLEGREYLDLPTAARLLSVSPSTLRRFIKAGRLRAYRIAGGRDLRFRRADILALVTPDTAETKEAATPAGLAALMGEASPAPEAVTPPRASRAPSPRGRTCKLCGAPTIAGQDKHGAFFKCSNPNCPDPPTKGKASKGKRPARKAGK